MSTNLKPKFSVVLIARNEAKTLPRLIHSLSDFQYRGGEVLLLDTGSTDGTPDVARQLGCMVKEMGDFFRIRITDEQVKDINERFVIEGELPVVNPGDSLFDYSSARNYIAQFSSNDVIFTPDCDEVLGKLDIDKINEHIENGVEQFEYQFIFAFDGDGKPLVQFLHSKFYDRKKLKWEGCVHEVLQGEAKRQYLDESVILLQHYQNVETDRSGYLKGLAYDCYMNPEKDRQSHYFAREMLYTGRYKSAIQEFKRHIDMNRWQTERSQSALFIGDAYQALNNKDETVKWYMKSFDLEPNRREPLMRLAEMAYKEGNAIQATAYCMAALQLNGVNFYANYQPYYTYYPHEILYWALWWGSGDKELSKYHYDMAVSLNPSSEKYKEDRKFYYPDPVKEGELEFTGERMIPGKMASRPDIEKEHIERYEFAAQFTEGRNVLDAGCGVGYGKEILKAGVYLGIDNSKEAIKYAKNTYGDGTFGVVDLENSDFKCIYDVDVVTCFEVIEHLENPYPFLEWVRKNSKVFIFSIPINMSSEFHKRVYSTLDIKIIIEKFFEGVVYYSQDETGIVGLPDGGKAKYIIGVATAKKLPAVSFLIPHVESSIKRRRGLEDCLSSIRDLNYQYSQVIRNGDAGSVPYKVSKMLTQSTGEYICYAADDMIFERDSVLIAIIESMILNKGLVSFNEGQVSSDKGNICTHFIIRRDLIDKIGGEIFDIDFHHVGVDNLLWAKCEKLGEAYHSEKAKIIHYHFSKGGIFDEVYKKGWAHADDDRQLLYKKLSELHSNT